MELDLLRLLFNGEPVGMVLSLEVVEETLLVAEFDDVVFHGR